MSLVQRGTTFQAVDHLSWKPLPGRICDTRHTPSRSISIAAFRPQAPITPPPG